MTIEEFHYTIKALVNKVDSEQEVDLLVPEIDSYLNRSMGVFIRNIAQPRNRVHLGFEKDQRTIDDIREIVEVKDYTSVINNEIELPEDYMYRVRLEAKGTKGKCENVSLRTKLRQHDDTYNNTFYKSSFKFRRVNYVFRKNTIIFEVDDFDVTKTKLVYIREPKYMHLAEKFGSGSYNLFDERILTGKQECELADSCHLEIAYYAAYLIAADIGLANVEQFFQNVKLINN